MKCEICGASMEKTMQYDYIIFKCPKCGHKVAVNIGIASIITKSWMEGRHEGYDKGFIHGIDYLMEKLEKHG